MEPLEREIVAQRPGARVGKHPAHLPGQNVGITEARFGGELQQLLIRQTAPQEERQTRRQLQIAQRANPAGRVSGFRSIEEMRARQDRAERIAHTAFEAGHRISRLVERHQRSEILVGHRAPEGAPCEVLDDLLRARRFVARRFGGLADEDLRAAGRLAHAGDRERPADLQGMRGLDALLPALQRDGASPLVAFGEACDARR